MRPLEDAVEFRARIIRNFAQSNSQLCDESGIGYWPIPVLIAVILSKALYSIHEEWLSQITACNYEVAAMLSEVRTRLTAIAAEGDLGEDHAAIYLRDHPSVREINVSDGPFYLAYKRVLNEDDAFILLGFVYSVEIGSLSAVKELASSRLIANKNYAALHMVEEVAHGALAAEIKSIVMQSDYADRFAAGCDLHDLVYEEALT